MAAKGPVTTLGRAGGWLVADLLLYLVALAVAVIAYGAATDQALRAGELVGNVVYYVGWTFPTVAAYLLAVWVLGRVGSCPGARLMAVALSPVVFLALYSLAAGDDTDALTIVLTLGLPAVVYGALVRIPFRDRQPRMRTAGPAAPRNTAR
jgi:hypothetical protein